MGASVTTAKAQMEQEQDPNAAFPWWIRFLAKGIGILGGVLSLFFGVLGLLSLTPICIAAALLQMAAGFFIIALEAPFCCAFVDFIERIAAFSESRAYWQKAALYCAMGIVPIFLCLGVHTFLGSGTIFASGVVYGFMALGRKADRGTVMGNQSDGAWNAQVNQTVPPPAGFNQP